MIGTQENQRNMLRFLWLKDPYVLNSEVIQLRFCRLVFGLRRSPSIQGATLTHHLDAHKDSQVELVELIRKSLYVDDLLTGADNVQEGFELYQESKELMAKGAFNLRKWNSNCNEESVAQKKTEKPNAEVEEEDESFIKSTVGPTRTADTLVKTLGVCWNTATDEISFDFTELIESANTMQATRRSLFQLTAKVFDPLGLLSPFAIIMKCQFQSLCVEKVDWNVELQGNHRRMWKD